MPDRNFSKTYDDVRGILRRQFNIADIPILPASKLQEDLNLRRNDLIGLTSSLNDYLEASDTTGGRERGSLNLAEVVNSATLIDLATLVHSKLER